MGARAVSCTRPRTARPAAYLLAAMAALAMPAASSALTVRVDPAGGAPRIVVDGRPVRARMFFGGPGSGPIRIGPEGRRYTFEFIAASGSAGAGTMHLRFGQSPGEAWLDDIGIADASTGRAACRTRTFEGGDTALAPDWEVWPPAERNTVGVVAVERGAGSAGSAGVHIGIRTPPGGDWPDFHLYHAHTIPLVAGRRYRVTFWARAVPARDVTVAIYRPGNTYAYLGGPTGPFASQIRMAAAAGVDFVSFPVAMPWPVPGAAVDWEPVDNACRQVLAANPRALLVPRFNADPPPWWRQAHPGDVMTWEDGSHQVQGAVASPAYRRDAAARAAALVAHLEAAFGNRVAGYHPCGQNTDEWFYQDTWGTLLSGYAPADTTAFRAWLRRRYRTDAALQTAWGAPAARLDTTAIPSPASRRAAPAGILRDPRAERALIDHAEFLQASMADMVCALGHAVRTASRGRKLSMFFYGYLFEFATVRLGPPTCGHYALRRVLNCPDIDVLCAPMSYFDRGPGGSGPLMSAAESVTLAGKMWLVEDDTRTHLANAGVGDGIAVARTVSESIGVLRRDIAQEATRNLATWWMDLPMTGWYDDPALWAEMRRLAPLDSAFLRRPVPFRPSIAAVIDERSMLAAASGAWRATEPGIYRARAALGRTGAPYGQYLLDDVLRGAVHARLYVFLNAWRMDQRERDAARRATAGAASIWCYAPGWIDGSRTSLRAMSDLTGFRIVRVSPASAVATPTAAGTRAGLTERIGPEGAIDPLFAAADATPAETLATYPDGSAAIAVRRARGGWSVFAGAPGLSSELLRAAARLGGVHLITQSDCVVHASGETLSLHAVRDGALQVDTGRPGPVRDALTGARLGTGPVVRIPLRTGTTCLLRLPQPPARRRTGTSHR